ncbi:MAG: hypothetical protein P8Y60_03170 [Calditrichota bacterium]
MKTSLIKYCFTILLAIWFADIIPVLAQDSVLVKFKMKDQFGNSHSNTAFQKKIVILIGSDREGGNYNGSWGKAIHDSLAEKNRAGQVEFLPVADLRGVPFFLKGFVKGKFPKKPGRWILLDWKGQFAETYHFKPDLSNILIFDQDGKLVYQTAVSELDQSELKNILDHLYFLLSKNG